MAYGHPTTRVGVRTHNSSKAATASRTHARTQPSSANPPPHVGRQIWAAAGDAGAARVQAQSLGGGGWVCAQTIPPHAAGAAGAAAEGATVCAFGAGACRSFLFAAGPGGGVVVFDTAALAAYLDPPT